MRHLRPDSRVQPPSYFSGEFHDPFKCTAVRENRQHSPPLHPTQAIPGSHTIQAQNRNSKGLCALCP